MPVVRKAWILLISCVPCTFSKRMIGVGSILRRKKRLLKQLPKKQDSRAGVPTCRGRSAKEVNLPSSEGRIGQGWTLNQICNFVF
mmetsp:Transcript_87917/g.155880  ORF Transcript_87917/g.155880 Transcript_87917/m.155880 type:complete len:85 (+) Transcript_87917:1493-1747(+)